MRTLEDQRAALLTASAALAELAAVDADRPVPSCPGWTMGALANHLGAIQRWAASIVRSLPDERPERDESGPTDASAAAGLRAATAELDLALQAVDPDAPCWSFGSDRTARFWFRRQAQEAMMHHHDAVTATGGELVFDPAAAVEGVTEFFDSFVWRWWTLGDWVGDGETCHLHATDTDGEWLITLTPERPALAFGHAKGDVAVRGSAQDLLLGLWRRAPLDGLEWFGSDADLARWRQRLTSTQI